MSTTPENTTTLEKKLDIETTKEEFSSTTAAKEIDPVAEAINTAVANITKTKNVNNDATVKAKTLDLSTIATLKKVEKKSSAPVASDRIEDGTIIYDNFSQPKTQIDRITKSLVEKSFYEEAKNQIEKEQQEEASKKSGLKWLTSVAKHMFKNTFTTKAVTERQKALMYTKDGALTPKAQERFKEIRDNIVNTDESETDGAKMAQQLVKHSQKELHQEKKWWLFGKSNMGFVDSIKKRFGLKKDIAFTKTKGSELITGASGLGAFSAGIFGLKAMLKAVPVVSAVVGGALVGHKMASQKVKGFDTFLSQTLQGTTFSGLSKFATEEEILQKITGKITAYGELQALLAAEDVTDIETALQILASFPDQAIITPLKELIQGKKITTLGEIKAFFNASEETVKIRELSVLKTLLEASLEYTAVNNSANATALVLLIKKVEKLVGESTEELNMIEQYTCEKSIEQTQKYIRSKINTAIFGGAVLGGLGAGLALGVGSYLHDKWSVGSAVNGAGKVLQKTITGASQLSGLSGVDATMTYHGTTYDVYMAADGMHNIPVYAKPNGVIPIKFTMGSNVSLSQEEITKELSVYNEAFKKSTLHLTVEPAAEGETPPVQVKVMSKEALRQYHLRNITDKKLQSFDASGHRIFPSLTVTRQHNGMWETTILCTKETLGEELYHGVLGITKETPQHLTTVNEAAVDHVEIHNINDKIAALQNTSSTTTSAAQEAVYTNTSFTGASLEHIDLSKLPSEQDIATASAKELKHYHTTVKNILMEEARQFKLASSAHAFTKSLTAEIEKLSSMKAGTQDYIAHYGTAYEKMLPQLQSNVNGFILPSLRTLANNIARGGTTGISDIRMDEVFKIYRDQITNPGTSSDNIDMIRMHMVNIRDKMLSSIEDTLRADGSIEALNDLQKLYDKTVIPSIKDERYALGLGNISKNITSEAAALENKYLTLESTYVAKSAELSRFIAQKEARLQMAQNELIQAQLRAESLEALRTQGKSHQALLQAIEEQMSTASSTGTKMKVAFDDNDFSNADIFSSNNEEATSKLDLTPETLVQITKDSDRILRNASEYTHVSHLINDLMKAKDIPGEGTTKATHVIETLKKYMFNKQVSGTNGALVTAYDQQQIQDIPVGNQGLTLGTILAANSPHADGFATLVESHATSNDGLTYAAIEKKYDNPQLYASHKIAEALRVPKDYVWGSTTSKAITSSALAVLGIGTLWAKGGELWKRSTGLVKNLRHPTGKVKGNRSYLRKYSPQNDNSVKVTLGDRSGKYTVEYRVLDTKGQEVFRQEGVLSKGDITLKSPHVTAPGQYVTIKVRAQNNALVLDHRYYE